MSRGTNPATCMQRASHATHASKASVNEHLVPYACVCVCVCVFRALAKSEPHILARETKGEALVCNVVLFCPDCVPGPVMCVMRMCVCVYATRAYQYTEARYRCSL